MSSSGKASFGMIGLAVMGRNLALNVEEHGFEVAAWNLEAEITDQFLAQNRGKKIVGTKSLQELVAALERPRRIMMLIKAGAPVDMTLDKLGPLLEEGDIVIDGGNSWFQDTRRREEALRTKKLHFVGMGTSGGEDGARHGPSLMPGGSDFAYDKLHDVLEAIAAKTESGPCVTHVGADGAGHFVKMVHNGIEYGDMQLIAEAYDLLHRVVGLETAELADVFDEWNRGPLESFLIEITAKIFRKKDEATGRPLVELVEDKAGQKGTGKWTAQVALDVGVPIPTIAAALDARMLSSMKAERLVAATRLPGPSVSKPAASERKALIAAVESALYAAKVCSYAQGMSLIRAGAATYQWKIDLREIARIWKGGCIIRARFLDAIMNAFERKPDLANLLLDEDFAGKVGRSQDGWRRVVGMAQAAGVPVPAFGASLAYYDSYRTPRLPQNVTQAQRDAFGSHTYERTDKPELGFIHTDWLGG
jgi:6-phosphogluconate dehydrogenase